VIQINQKYMGKKIILLAAVIVVLIILFAGSFFTGQAKSDYSIVYLSTGEVYIGKLDTFPGFELTGGYVFQVVPDLSDPKKSNFQLNAVKEALWSPEKLHFVESNVVFYGQLSVESAIAKKLLEQEEQKSSEKK